MQHLLHLHVELHLEKKKGFRGIKTDINILWITKSVTVTLKGGILTPSGSLGCLYFDWGDTAPDTPQRDGGLFDFDCQFRFMKSVYTSLEVPDGRTALCTTRSSYWEANQLSLLVIDPILQDLQEGLIVNLTKFSPRDIWFSPHGNITCKYAFQEILSSGSAIR